MANDEHVAMLARGAAAWNEWRAKDDEGPDLSGTGLRGLDLSGFDLSGANLRGADLRGTNLCDAKLSGAHLDGANFFKAVLETGDRDRSATGAVRMWWLFHMDGCRSKLWTNPCGWVSRPHNNRFRRGISRSFGTE